jgi:hypothetical protein
MKKYINLFSLCLSIITYSCSNKFIVNKNYVINREKGVAVFIDKDSKRFRNIEKGDVFIDSLIPDFFISYKFKKSIISRQDLNLALTGEANKNVSFFYLRGDCNETNRNSYVNQDAQEILLDTSIDNYLHSNKIFLVPVELEYLNNNIDREYYNLYKTQIIIYKQKRVNLIFNRGFLDVLKINVLEGEWNKVP